MTTTAVIHQRSRPLMCDLREFFWYGTRASEKAREKKRSQLQQGTSVFSLLCSVSACIHGNGPNAAALHSLTNFPLYASYYAITVATLNPPLLFIHTQTQLPPSPTHPPPTVLLFPIVPWPPLLGLVFGSNSCGVCHDDSV